MPQLIALHITLRFLLKDKPLRVEHLFLRVYCLQCNDPSECNGPLSREIFVYCVHTSPLVGGNTIGIRELNIVQEVSGRRTIEMKM